MSRVTHVLFSESVIYHWDVSRQLYVATIYKILYVFAQLCRYLTYIPVQVTIRTISYVAIGITHTYHYVNYNDKIRINVLATYIANSYVVKIHTYVATHCSYIARIFLCSHAILLTHAINTARISLLAHDMHVKPCATWKINQCSRLNHCVL